MIILTLFATASWKTISEHANGMSISRSDERLETRGPAAGREVRMAIYFNGHAMPMTWRLRRDHRAAEIIDDAVLYRVSKRAWHKPFVQTGLVFAHGDMRAVSRVVASSTPSRAPLRMESRDASSRYTGAHSVKCLHDCARNR
ncbi:MAG: hypothetical protein QOK44_1014 [Betaproteobacteria bacterium]|nr:hypothetical protein [Betaproteobacteria bacterium]